ncbi:MAG: IS66 family insertion sequence element accessory protein TnpB [Saprospiraceae bacterium]|nr:IS66 family insertion sequence element accessory protein TnpB [Saprospiraceae bacterium]
MRKGYDGLSGLVRNELGADPLSGDVCIFQQGRQTVKMLVWGPGRICNCTTLSDWRGCYEQLSGIIDGNHHISTNIWSCCSGISLVDYPTTHDVR